MNQMIRATTLSEVDFSRSEDACQCLNRAKWMVFEYVMEQK
jgi:hypothetical protein